ncbi:glutathione hydrolase 5 proenzyme-like [Erpetoichthys calabaricus]|uniref:Glutathione hydrolase n=1 Tax=Erpetoichthys calabaricus TaxID=27687 RepID=A0A8C4SXB4_ERPCA|nr:glutathione hydrolase 5 proenzyme-like [Erpetoichthys calabaricus]
MMAYRSSRTSRTRVRCCIFFVLLCIIGLIVLGVLLSGTSNCKDGFRHAAVAADTATCSEVGKSMLQNGGSAVDSAIAALLCTSLLNPQSMGIGGGVIFNIYEASGKVTIINARETVPQNTPEFLRNCTGFLNLGSLWIGVPGEIRGYEEAHKRFGKLPWKTLFQPSIKLAREGFPVSRVLSAFLSHLQPFLNKTNLRELFFKTGMILKEEDTLKFQKLADTLEIIAENGANAFYEGQLAEDLVKDIKELGGYLTTEDLKNFKVKVEQPLQLKIGDNKLYVPPPPIAGAILGFILNIMKGYQLNPDSLMKNNVLTTYHRFIEALKMANGQKLKIKDPKFSNRTQNDAALLISDKFADFARSQIQDDQTHPFPYYGVSPSFDSTGTTHISIIDKDGNSVSVTSTINSIFGAMMYSRRTGIILNNQLSDFCGRATHVSPGEQPPSSMTPAILVSSSNRPILVIGGSGGSMITGATALAMVNYLWLGQDLKEAIKAQVVHVNSKNEVQFEKDFDPVLKQELISIGHNVTKNPYFFNVVNAISSNGKCFRAVSDQRKDGQPAGY